MRHRWSAIVLAMLFSVSALSGGVWAQAGDLVDMEFEEARLSDVVRVLGELGGYNVIVDPSVQGNVTFRLRGMSVDEAIEMVVRTSGYSYRQMGNTLVVGSEATLRARFDAAEAKVLRLEYADPPQLLSVLRLLLPGVEAQVDPLQRALVVRGTPEDVARAEQFVRERDVPPLVTQEFAEARVVEILQTLARLGGYNLVAEGEITGSMTVSLQRQSVEAAIDLVTRRAGLEYEIDGANLFVYGRPQADGRTNAPIDSTVTAPVREQRLIRLVHISPSKILEAVRVIAAGGEVWADEASGTMIVSAGAEALRQIDELVALLDVPTIAVRGVLQQGDERLAIVQIDQGTHIVRPGDSVGAIKVLAVDIDGVLIETVHGQRVHVGAGGR